jgi:phosphoenolpyruvate carboxykinase (ATP)
MPTQTDPVFGLEVVTRCPDVPDDILLPRNTWSDGAAYDTAAAKLAERFRENFRAYADGVSDEVRHAGPTA